MGKLKYSLVGTSKEFDITIESTYHIRKLILSMSEFLDVDKSLIVL